MLLGNVTRVVRCGGFLLVDFVGSGVEFLVHLSLLFVFFFVFVNLLVLCYGFHLELLIWEGISARIYGKANSTL